MGPIRRGDDLFCLEDRIWLWTRSIGVPIYDFAFEHVFACRRPRLPDDEIERQTNRHSAACRSMGRRLLAVLELKSCVYEQ